MSLTSALYGLARLSADVRALSIPTSAARKPVLAHDRFARGRPRRASSLQWPAPRPPSHS